MKVRASTEEQEGYARDRAAQRHRFHDAPVDAGVIDARLAEQGIQWNVISGTELARWTGAAPVLTDDYAPVDQLLTPYPDR